MREERKKEGGSVAEPAAESPAMAGGGVRRSSIRTPVNNFEYIYNFFKIVNNFHKI